LPKEEKEKMSCQSCGAKVVEQDVFCKSCGKSLRANQETELYSFGPWAVNVCFSRPGTFVMMQKNNTKIVLTNQQIYGSSTFNNSKRFQVPYPIILAMENYDYSLNLGPWKVLWIKYMEPEKIREVSIMCFGPNSADIIKAFNIIIGNLPGSSST
jgi:hypothetical protein